MDKRLFQQLNQDSYLPGIRVDGISYNSHILTMCSILAMFQFLNFKNSKPFDTVSIRKTARQAETDSNFSISLTLTTWIHWTDSCFYGITWRTAFWLVNNSINTFLWPQRISTTTWGSAGRPLWPIKRQVCLKNNIKQHFICLFAYTGK